MDNMIIMFVLALVTITVLGYLIKTASKVVAVAVIIFVLFGLGFVWGPADLNEKLGLNKFLSPEASQQVTEKYTEFTEKRDSNGTIINQEQMKIIYDNAEATATTQSLSFFEKAKTKFLEFFGIVKEQTEAEIKAQIQAEIQAQLANTAQTTTPTP